MSARDALRQAREWLAEPAEDKGVDATYGLAWAMVALAEAIIEDAAGELKPQIVQHRDLTRRYREHEHDLWQALVQVLGPAGWKIRTLDGDPWLLHEGCVDGPGVYLDEYADTPTYGLYLGPDTMIERLTWGDLLDRLTELGYLPAG